MPSFRSRQSRNPPRPNSAPQLLVLRIIGQLRNYGRSVHRAELGDLIRQSDSSASLPGSTGYRRGLWHSRVILPASTPSGLSPLYFPGLPPSASAGSPDSCTPVHPYRHWPSDQGAMSLATPSARSNQLHAELAFDDWFVRFRHGPPVCSHHRADQTSGGQCPLGLPRFYVRAFRSPGHPECLPDITTTPN